MAVRNGHLSVVEYLVNGNADMNAKTKKGETPLELACHYEFFDSIDLKKRKSNVVQFFLGKRVK